MLEWSDRTTNQTVYGDLKKVSTILLVRRLKFAAHAWRRKNELASKILFWESTQERRTRGRPFLTYVDQLKRDTGLTTQELKSCMDDRIGWKILVNNARASSN